MLGYRCHDAGKEVIASDLVMTCHSPAPFHTYLLEDGWHPAYE
jgi:hypothetical protein